MVIWARVVLALLVISGSVSAAPDPNQEAEREYKLGFDALQTGDCATALVHYQRSFALVRRPRTLFNMAVCQEQLGQDLDAWRSYQAFVGQAEPRDATIVARAKERLEILRARLSGTVSVDATARSSVFVDSERQARGETPLTLTLPPGSHVLRVVAPGGSPVDRTIQVNPGETTVVSVEIPLPSTISIRVEPADATIEEVGITGQVTGALVAKMTVGHHEYTVRRIGLRTERVVVDAVAGRSYEHQITMRPDRDAATLIVEGLDGATLTLDGRAVPPATSTSRVLAMRDLPAGDHAIQVEHPRYRPWSQRLQLLPGETVVVELALAPKQTNRRTLAWTAGGIGAASVVVGGVLGVLALGDVTSDSSDRHARGDTRAWVADGMFALGAAAVIIAWRLARDGASSAIIHRNGGE